jgi:hypothetical protein
MLSLTDAQLGAVTNAARHLDPHQRSALLAALPYIFAGKSEIGDGELARALRELQREQLRSAQASQSGWAQASLKAIKSHY